MHGLVREDKWRPTAKIFDYPDRSESKRARAKAPAKDTTQPKISSLFVVQPAAPVATPLPEPTFDIGANVRARYVQKGYEVRTDDGDQVQLVEAVIVERLPRRPVQSTLSSDWRGSGHGDAPGSGHRRGRRR